MAADSESESQQQLPLEQLVNSALKELENVRINLEMYTLSDESSADGTIELASANFLENVDAGSSPYALIGNPGVGKTKFLQATIQKWAHKKHLNRHYIYFDLLPLMKQSMPRRLGKKAALCYMFTRSILYKDFSKRTVAEITSLMIDTQGQNFVIVLDHLDDLTLQQLPVVTDMLSKELLPQANIVVAGNLNIFNSLNRITKGSFRCYVLEGIKQGNETEVLESLKSEYRGSEYTVEHIKHNFPELCTNPDLIRKLMVMYREKPPATTTKMMEGLIVSIINEHLRKQTPPQSIQSLSTLSNDLLEELRLVSHHAYLSIVSDTDQYSLNDLTKHVTLHRGEEYAFDEHSLGLLVLAKPARSQGTSMFKFVHRIVKQFLCAFHLAMEPMLDQLRLIYHNIDIFQYGKHSNVSKFYFGMGPILSGPLSSANKLKSEATWALKPLLETVIGGELRIDEEPNIKREKLLHVYELLVECQDTNLVRKFLSKREKYLNFSLESTRELSGPLIRILSFIMTHSGIAKWSIAAPESAYHTVEYISMLVNKESSKSVDVRTSVSNSDNFVVQPLLRSGGQLKSYPVVTMYVRCMREILHRVLQLFSPIKLKSNGTESSYVSFLACECLKEKYEKEQIFTIQPIHAVHWISVKSKQKNSASKTSGEFEETENQRHMVRHNMEYLEMVLMMSPLPNRICFKNPSDESKMEVIELCRSVTPEARDGRIEKSLKNHFIDEDESLIIAEETTCGDSSELVALPLIIPATFKGLLGVVFNSDQSAHPAILARQDTKTESNLPEASGGHQKESVQHAMISGKAESKRQRETVQQAMVYGEAICETNNNNSLTYHSSQPESNEPLKKLRLNTRHGFPEVEQNAPLLSNNGQREYPQQVSLSQSQTQQDSHHVHAQQKYFFNQQQQQSYHQGSAQPSSQANTQLSSSSNLQKQVAVPAGTILYSVNHELFPLDTIQRLPDEGNLIRRGGNGTVFSVAISSATHGQFNFAVKKTAFRNREFQIHKKLKHQNIIELACFMFGLPQPKFKRRYFCYHFMPRVTGDLARMVTDNPDMTMQSLSLKYSNDPLKLGSMQGNWKYILKELLKGLGYMHSLQIVHRDIKASNILIQMACNIICDSPLTCTCSRKFAVKISDFDSALELDKNGTLQPMPYAAQAPSQQKQASVYQITPVGTDGYRSPESSQLILTNDPSALMPALTVKSDIWSTGLIMMRMLNGTNGPTTQQKVNDQVIRSLYNAEF